MKRWTLGLVAVLAVGLALLVALFYPGGSGTPRSSAHVNTGAAHIEIDVVQDAGAGTVTTADDVWCNPVQNTANVDLQTVHKAAICLSDADLSPGAFNIELNYDSDWNLCADTGNDATDPSGYDHNPDANEGATVFAGTAGTWTALGTGCDCSSGQGQFPTCDYWPGPPEGAGASIRTAYVSCVCSVTQTLPFGAGVSSPLAVVTFTAAGNGDDILTFGTVAVYKVGGNLVSCDSTTSAACFGATVHKGNVPSATPTITNTPLPPTATPTMTNTPLPTATPTITNTPLPTATPTITNTPLPATNTPTATATSTPTNTPEPSPTPTFTPTPTIWAFIDKNVNNNCNPDTRQTESTETVGDTHELAVCLANVPMQIEGFNLVVTYNADLDQCIDSPCADNDPNCLDSNPDANAGATTFGESLGSDWDCNLEGVPRCTGAVVAQTDTLAVPADGVAGSASILCERRLDAVEAVNTTIQFQDFFTLAAIKFNVLAAGTDNVNIQYLDVWGPNDTTIGHCERLVGTDENADTVLEQMRCDGATDIKERVVRRRTATPSPGPTATVTVPSATPVPPPPATATPLGGVGTQIVPPPTGSGSSSGSFPWTLALLGAAAGTAALAGGLSLRLGWVRRRAR